MDLRLQQQIYNLLFRRNSVFVPTIFIGAFAFSIGFDQITSEFWDRHNKGVSRTATVDRKEMRAEDVTGSERLVTARAHLSQLRAMQS